MVGDTIKGKALQQQFESAWQGEAFGESLKIGEWDIDYDTYGPLQLAEHEPFWRWILEHRYIFTEGALNIAEMALYSSVRLVSSQS